MAYSLAKKREIYRKILNKLIVAYSNHKMRHGVGQNFEECEALLWRQRDDVYKMTADELRTCNSIINEARHFLLAEINK